MKKDMKEIIDKLNELVRLVKKSLRNIRREKWWKDFEKRNSNS